VITRYTSIMSLWQTLLDHGKRLFDIDTHQPLSAEEQACAPDPRDVGFTTAVIGLGAKL